MDETRIETTEQTPEEVVLRYEAQPKEVVHYYVQPTYLRGEEAPRADIFEVPKRRRRGLKIFLVLFAIILVSAGIVAAVFWEDIVWSFRGEFDHNGEHYEFAYGEEFEFPDLPTYPAGGDARVLYRRQGEKELTPAEIYEKVGPSVVTVMGELDDRGSASVGTGIIFSPDGCIVTTAHVLADCHTCYVALYTGGTYTAELVGRDAATDLAVLKIHGEDLIPAEFGDSNALRVGDPVYAIGNPLGIELIGTFTDGMVSALDRMMPEDVSLPLIQTNASLNSGNSGGPLINRYGQVVGINTMKLVKTYRNEMGIEGLGFSLPVSDCAYLINNLVRSGEIGGETVLGITVLTNPVTLPDGTHALEIQSVTENGPGDKAGVQGGDFLVSADGEVMWETIDLLRVRRSHDPGEALSLVIWRDGLYMTYEVYPE